MELSPDRRPLRSECPLCCGLDPPSSAKVWAFRGWGCRPLMGRGVKGEIPRFDSAGAARRIPCILIQIHKLLTSSTTEVRDADMPGDATSPLRPPRPRQARVTAFPLIFHSRCFFARVLSGREGGPLTRLDCTSEHRTLAWTSCARNPEGGRSQEVIFPCLRFERSRGGPTWRR